MTIKVLFIFVLFFILFFNFVRTLPPELVKMSSVTIFENHPSLGVKNYNKFVWKNPARRDKFPTSFIAYPKKMPTFVDDTYCMYDEAFIFFLFIICEDLSNIFEGRVKLA